MEKLKFGTPIVLHVDDPDEFAQRCWDAGLRVLVRRNAPGQASLLSVIDRFGRQIDVKRRLRERERKALQKHPKSHAMLRAAGQDHRHALLLPPPSEKTDASPLAHPR